MAARAVGDRRSRRGVPFAVAGDGGVDQRRVVLIGGTGRIGTAAAIHMLNECDPRRSGQVDGLALNVMLAGRGKGKGEKAVEEVLREVGGVEALAEKGHRVSFLPLDYKHDEALDMALQGADAVLHCAGPYMNESPRILEAAISASVPVYADVADPIDYLAAAVAMGPKAAASGTKAVVSAGAFPGLSNVMAMEVAQRLDSQHLRDLDFSYFTAGLGGSGVLNLLITNLGFGEPVPTMRNGRLSPQMNAGLDSKTVPFFLPDNPDGPASERIGERRVWAWPFPEVCTTAEELKISGDSNVRMGTAPDIWNVILGGMAAVIPRSWWRSNTFSDLLARFSEPMVKLTDLFVGEWHAIRVDLTTEDGRQGAAIQVHESFRRCVGQSLAEFALHLMQPEVQPGVFLPEQLARDKETRSALLSRMTATPGTVEYNLWFHPWA